MRWMREYGIYYDLYGRDEIYKEKIGERERKRECHQDDHHDVP